MGLQNNLFDVKKSLIVSAQSYFKLLNISVVIECNDFVNQQKYVLRFFKDGFLHLTGLQTSLSKITFFEKCLSGTIEFDDFSYGPKRDKKTVKRKLKALSNIYDMFSKKLLAQESFLKNKIECKIATSDGKCTIGFVDAKKYLRPKTILANNHLDAKKPIYYVKPVFVACLKI